MAKTSPKEQIVLDRDYVEKLQRKAFLFEEILSFLEDKNLGFLMEKTEKEKNIPLSKVKKKLK